MLSVIGIYQNGELKLENNYTTKHPVKVLVTFLEEIQSNPEIGISLDDFSFAKSKEILREYKGSLADSVVEERRSE